MSLELLTNLQAAHAFDHAPLRHDLGVYHVPFAELADGIQSPEERLGGATARGERVVVVGRSGSGKSSLIEHVLNPLAPGIAPIPVPMAGEPTEVATNPQAVAGMIIQTLVDLAEGLTTAQRASALEGAASQRLVPRRLRGSGLALGAGWMGAELRAEIQRQAPPGIRLMRTTHATLEVLDQLLLRIQADDLMPVLVFDDTDRWFRRVGGDVDHRDLALAFFATVLPQLRERPAGLVVAAHLSYFEDGDLSDHLRGSTDMRIDVPVLASPVALGRVLHSRVVAHVSPDNPDAAPDLDELLSADGLARLFGLYEGQYDRAIRNVIQTMHVAVTDACTSRFDRVTAELVDQAVW